jgi:hypothetical protein
MHLPQEYSGAGPEYNEGLLKVLKDLHIVPTRGNIINNLEKLQNIM